MWIIGISVAGGLAITALVLGIVFGALRQVRVAGQKMLSEQFPGGVPSLSSPGANCFGVESRGRWQVRGNGALAISPAGLWFRGVMNGIALDVPLEQLRGVELVDSHLSKRVFGRKLLKIHFQGEQGAEDSVAFLVDNPGRWQQEIERLRYG
ncbi:MAG TPA: hypothetical protein PLA94_21600 [Myxococcota bacterium]|nr:hypothetical protein [Myxococcota bacterium]HND32612.1 hypothetical protein [Myxococcota bacterium]